MTAELLQARLRTAWAFLAVALLAMLVAGFAAAATAHTPTRHIMWMVAYLVLVVGLIQAALGLGQSMLSTQLPSRHLVIGECVLFNSGNAGVIMGTLLAWPALVAVGTVIFATSLLLFLLGIRRARGWPAHVFRGLLLLACASAIVGVSLSFMRA